MAKNNKPIIVRYDPLIYPMKIYVCKNCELKHIQKLFPDVVESDYKGYGAATISGLCCKKNNENSILVVLNDEIVNSKNIPEKSNTAAHEATHCVTDMFDYLGLPLTREAQESYAYMIGWVTECILKTMYKK